MVLDGANHEEEKEGDRGSLRGACVCPSYRGTCSSSRARNKVLVGGGGGSHEIGHPSTPLSLQRSSEKINCCVAKERTPGAVRPVGAATIQTRTLRVRTHTCNHVNAGRREVVRGRVYEGECRNNETAETNQIVPYSTQTKRIPDRDRYVKAAGSF